MLQGEGGREGGREVKLQEYAQSGEVGGVLELLHVLFTFLGFLWGVEAFLGEEAVVGVVEVHPHGEDLADVLGAANGVLAEEGEGAVPDEVAREDGLGEQVEDDQLLDELHEALLLRSLQLVRQAQVVLAVLVVVAQPAVPHLPLDRQQLRHLPRTHHQRALVCALRCSPGYCRQVGQLAREHLLREEPLCREVQLACAVVAQVEVEELAQAGQRGEVGDHTPLLEGGVVGEVDAADPLREQPREQRGRLVLVRDVVLLLHGVVALEEGPAAGEAAPHERDVLGAQADVRERLRLRVEVELALARVGVVLNELGPLLQVGALGLDEVGQVRRDHRHHVLDRHLVDEPREEEAVLLLPLHAHQQDLPAGVQLLRLLLAPVVQLHQHQSVRDVEAVLARRLSRRLVLGQVVEQVQLDDVRLLGVVDLSQLLLEGGVDTLDAPVVVLQILVELLLGGLTLAFRAGSGPGCLVALVVLVVQRLLIHQLLVELLDRSPPVGRVVSLPHRLHLLLSALHLALPAGEPAANAGEEAPNSRSLSQHAYYNSGKKARQQAG